MSEIDRFSVSSGDATYTVLAMPRPALRVPEGLTDAELSVLMLVLAGLSNEQIADARRSAVRTVANQVAALLAKTGAASRRELVARCRAEPEEGKP
jgi:DNA-binding NarL/FixJ family response regulator